MATEITCPGCGKKIDPSVDYGSVGGRREPEGTTRADGPPRVCPCRGEKNCDGL